MIMNPPSGTAEFTRTRHRAFVCARRGFCHCGSHAAHGYRERRHTLLLTRSGSERAALLYAGQKASLSVQHPLEHRGAHRRSLQPDARIVRAGRSEAVRAHPVGKGAQPARAPAQGCGAPGAPHGSVLRTPGRELAGYRAAEAPRAALERDRRDHAQLAEGRGQAGKRGRGAFFGAGDAAHLPPLLYHAHALSPPAAQGHPGAGRSQGCALDRGVHGVFVLDVAATLAVPFSGEGAEAAAVLRSLPPG